MFRIVVAAALLTAMIAPLSAADAPAYSLDVLLPLTGQAAYAGQAEQAGMRAYEAAVNRTGGMHGQPLHFDFHDDQSNPAVAVQLVNQILTKHPVAVLGSAVTAMNSAIAPLFVNGPVNFGFSPAIMPAKGSYVFAAAASLQAVMFAGYAKIHQLGYHRLATIISTDATGQQNEKFTREAMALPSNRGLELVDLENFNPTDTSVAAQVAKMRSANPDIIYIWAIGTAFATALREISNEGLDVTIATTPVNANVDMLTQVQPFLPKTLIVQGLPYQGRLDSPGLKAAAAEYLGALKDAGVPPNSTQPYAWDPTRIVVEALRKMPAGATAADLRTYLAGLHDFSGLFGTYDFRSGDQHGLDGRDSPFIQYNTARKDWTMFDQRPAK